MKHAFLTRPFVKEATQKGQSKEQYMRIKQKQKISSQSFLRNPSTLKSSLQFVWSGAVYKLSMQSVDFLSMMLYDKLCKRNF